MSAIRGRRRRANRLKLPARIGLIVNLDSMDEVRAVYETVRSVDGVELLGEVEEAFWGGGFSWRDPEGDVWDVAWAKGTTLDERGGLTFP